MAKILQTMKKDDEWQTHRETNFEKTSIIHWCNTLQTWPNKNKNFTLNQNHQQIIINKQLELYNHLPTENYQLDINHQKQNHDMHVKSI